MKAFAELLDNLIHTPQRNGKLRLLADYFARSPDPDRGWALAILAGTVDLPGAKATMVRGLTEARVDPTLFALSYDYVGDLAETVSLLWPGGQESDKAFRLSRVVLELRNAGRNDVPLLIEGWLDEMPISQRFALLKLLMGGLRVGVSARIAKTALADFGDKLLAEIEELWFGLTPPYESLFAWLENKAPPPQIDDRLAFRPPMLANPLDEADLSSLDPAAFAAEWKWDGIRVLLVARGDERRLYSRAGDDIGRAFPDVLSGAEFDAVIDGELLVARDGIVAPFNDLQKRLGRKIVTKKMLAEFPAHLRLYDILFEAGEDLRPHHLMARRKRLEGWHAVNRPSRIDLSPLIEFDTWEALAELRANARTDGIEGLMLKRWDSAYLAGRSKGPWFKWKRDPMLVDCVLMYAQRGHGRRSSFYSDYTFGCWRDAEDGRAELVPVGKAYFGFTNNELIAIDRWVRAHATERFGPVRAVEPGLVFEVAFDSIHPSSRHKSGLAMRFPRIHRIRWDKPAEDADWVDNLSRLAG